MQSYQEQSLNYSLSQNEIANAFQQFQIRQPINNLPWNSMKNVLHYNSTINQVNLLNSISNNPCVNSNSLLSSSEPFHNIVPNNISISNNTIPSYSMQDIACSNFTNSSHMQNMITSCFTNAFKSIFNQAMFPMNNYYQGNNINNVSSLENSIALSQFSNVGMPIMEPKFAKKIIIQLVNQLKESGELNSDNFKETLNEMLLDTIKSNIEPNIILGEISKKNKIDMSNQNEIITTSMQAKNNNSCLSHEKLFESDSESDTSICYTINSHINKTAANLSFHNGEVKKKSKLNKCKRKSEIERLKIEITLPSSKMNIDKELLKKYKKTADLTSISVDNKEDFVWPVTKTKSSRRYKDILTNIVDFDFIKKYKIRDCKVVLENIGLKFNDSRDYNNVDMKSKIEIEEESSMKAINIFKSDIDLSHKVFKTIKKKSKKRYNTKFIKKKRSNFAKDAVIFDNKISELKNESSTNDEENKIKGFSKKKQLFNDKVTLKGFNSIEEITFLENMNELKESRFIMMNIGRPEDNMERLAMHSVSQFGKSFIQCSFCPKLEEKVAQLTDHILIEHSDLTFALSSLESSNVSEALLIVCRHCDFASIDKVIMAIHFEIYHGIPGCIYNISQTKIQIPQNYKFIAIDQHSKVKNLKCFLCNDCNQLSPNIKNMSCHIQIEHASQGNFNGCFTKMRAIDEHFSSEKEIKDFIDSDQYFSNSVDAFFCIVCDTTVFCPYKALSHYLKDHQTKKVLLCCLFSTCKFTSFIEAELKDHLVVKHKVSYNFYCSSTMIDITTDQKYFECEPLYKRKSHFIRVQNSRINQLKILPVQENSFNNSNSDFEANTFIKPVIKTTYTPIEIVPAEMPIQIKPKNEIESFYSNYDIFSEEYVNKTKLNENEIGAVDFANGDFQNIINYQMENMNIPKKNLDSDKDLNSETEPISSFEITESNCGIIDTANEFCDETTYSIKSTNLNENKPNSKDGVINETISSHITVYENTINE